MKEHDVSQKDICGLADEHPLKEAYFSAHDEEMFLTLLEKFIAQVRPHMHTQPGGPAHAGCTYMARQDVQRMHRHSTFWACVGGPGVWDEGMPRGWQHTAVR